MKTEKSPERLVFFSDAVVAIALTLLVLPLADIVPEVVATHGNPAEVITDNGWRIFSFVLSFVVIARLWMVHHRLFADVTGYTVALVWVNFLWLLTIAVLPFPTEMMGAFGDDKFTELCYIGTIFVNSLCLTTMTLMVRSDERLTTEPGAITDARRLNAVATTVALAVAFALTVLVPGVAYYSLLLLLLPPQFARLRYGRQGRDLH